MGPENIANEADAGEAKNQARLFITEMIMENFKSYAGVQHVGPFHKCFSAVVGPNGSGKSNVIDAMLFVFGKRAKQMRLNKVSELIHNSTHHQNLEKARVSVHFQEILDLDDETYEPVPGTDFVITRVAFRNNSSQYFINDRSSTFTEVTKKLRAKGVDLDNNRFLILQGEVEQISLMKPKGQTPHDEGFLEYLEDIIGSNQYVEKIEEASKLLEELNEKRVSMVNRVKLAEKEKDSLQNAKREAENYLLKEAELLRWRGKAVELDLEVATTEATKYKQIADDLNEKLREERDKLSRHSKDIKELEKNYSKECKLQEELEVELKRCADQFKEFERQDLKFREDLKHSKSKTKKLDEKISKDTLKIEELEKETHQSTIDIPFLEEDIVNLSKRLVVDEEKLEGIIEESKDEVERYQEELTVVRSELEPWEAQLTECQGRIDLTTTERSLLQDKHNAGRLAYTQGKEAVQDVSNQIRVKEASFEKMNLTLNENQTLTRQGHAEEQACQRDEESVAVAEQAARQRLSELQRTMESERSQGVVLKAILQAKESGAIPGIYGRLGDLGAIDAKYDVAISTACGALDYIVVETTSAAQACVELLRSARLGVATFFIMEKQVDHLQRMIQRVQTPEGVPRLFDLVTVRDEALKLAFFVNLQNTVVAKDIDQASRIAYGPDREFRRVVTLDGVMFERSGTMSGGGGKPKGGKMGTAVRDATVSPQTIQNAEREVASLGEQLRSVRSRRTSAVQQYQTAERTISQLELDIQKNRLEVEALSIQRNDLVRQLEVLQVEANPRKDEIETVDKLQKIIADAKSHYANLQANSKQLRDKVQELQKNMQDAGGDALKKQRALVEKTQKEIDTKSTEINRKKVQITTGAKTIEKLKKGIEDAIVERTKCHENKENKTLEFKEIEKLAFDVQEKFNQTEQMLEKKRQEVEAMKKHFHQEKQTIDNIRHNEVDAQYKLDDTKNQALQWGTKEKNLQKKLQETRNELEKHVEQLKQEEVCPEQIEAALTFCDSATMKKAADVAKELEAKLKEMKPSRNAIAEFRLKAAQYGERIAELNAITQERDELKKQHDDLRKKRLDEFMTGFNLISMKLKEMYQMITLGGDAELELVDSLDPFAEGVVFSVRPPKKSWKNISNLSGGEKTLSSLALVFALHHYKPTPLYVMDEIDAALDFKNVSIVGHYIKERTKNAQFVIISLRNNMFELADRLIGIYKTDNCTKSLTINPKSFTIAPRS